MFPDANRICKLCNDICFFRERILAEIPEICPFDPDLADRVMVARESLYKLYESLDKIALELTVD